jgi:PleD family two-component response regulator
MNEEKSKMLIVEDDLDLADMLSTFFTVENYTVRTAAWGEEGLRACKDDPPDIVMLDIRLPDISGYDVCRQLRQQPRTQDIPILFLTEKRDRVDKLTGLELGVVDYITKPFDIQELRLRVRNVLKRAAMQTMTNPVTDLPDSILTDDRLSQVLESDSPWGVLLLSIEGLDRLREQFGFVAADEMLRAIALMTRTALREVGGESDFIGHFTPSSFALVTSAESLSAVRERAEARIQYSIATFYKPVVWGGDGVPNTSDDMLKLRTAAVYYDDPRPADLPDLRARLHMNLNAPHAPGA